MIVNNKNPKSTNQITAMIGKCLEFSIWPASVLLYLQIPIVSPAEAAQLALKYRIQGFTTLKLKVGKYLKSDIEVLQAIRAVHADCLFILDANEGYKPEEAVEVLEKLHGMHKRALLSLLSACMPVTKLSIKYIL